MAQAILALFLDQDKDTDDERPDERLAGRRRQLLRRLENILRSVILEDPHIRKEAKTWLVTSIAKCKPKNPQQVAAFLGFLPKPRRHAGSHSAMSKSTEARLLRQLVLLLCESRTVAPQLARLLSRDADMVKKFFAKDEGRVETWFRHFASVGGEHSFGAKALAQFAIRHRDDCWEELEWAGSHPQAPGTVAIKLHYFAELDVVRTVRNFLKHVPDFWTSGDWRDCLSCGEFLALDPDFFADKVVKILEGRVRKGSSDDEAEYVEDKLLEIVEAFLQEETFPTLCRRLLHLSSPEGLLSFLERLRDDDVSNKLRDPQLAAVADVSWRAFDDAVLCNACAANGRQVVRLLEEDEFLKQREELDDLVLDASSSAEDVVFRAFRAGLRTRSKASERNWLILESWLLRWRLSKVATEPETIQRILESNRIAYRPSVDVDREPLRDSIPETEPKRSKLKRGRRKGRGKRRKRRSPSATRSAESDESTSSDSGLERRYKKRRHSSESRDGNREAGEGREDEMKEVQASDAEETHERPEPLRPHRKRRRRKGGGSSSESKEKSGKGRQGEHKGTPFEGSKGSLADADGAYLQTDGFRFQWSLPEIPDHLAEHSLAVWLGWKPS